MGEGTREHRVAIAVGNKSIGTWITYEVQVSMVQPVSSFSFTRAFDAAAWRLLEPDAEVTISIDDRPILTGLIDERERSTRDGTIGVRGRDRVGRLSQESVPAGLQLEGLLMTEAIRRIADPWFKTVSLSNARNRKIVTGKAGHKAPAGNEPLVIDSLHRKGRVERGMMRWPLIEEMLSEAGYVAFSSGDGRELVVAAPNYAQGIQFELRHARPGSSARSTVKDLKYKTSVADRYSLITVSGAGAGDSADYGDRVMYDGAARNGPGADGTGIDFDHAKRLHLSERAVQSKAEADRIAAREMARRDMQARTIHAELALHGQAVGGGARVLFAPDTLARVIDEQLEPELDEAFLALECTYTAARGGGETTRMMLVPKGTKVVH